MRLPFKLKHANLYTNLNMIMTSDHGFATVKEIVRIKKRDDLFKTVVPNDDYWHVEPNEG